MQLTEDSTASEFVIKSYQDGCLTVNQERYQESLIITSQQLITDWPPQSVTALEENHLQAILDLKPEVVIIGTGKQHAFINPELLDLLYRNHIGVEVMDTQAACRTLSILMSDNRNVAGALFL